MDRAKTVSLRSAALVCALAFVVLFAYAIARPATESLFLESYGADWLPAVWATVAAVIVVVVGGYNAAAARRGLTTVFLGAIAAAAASLVLLLLFAQGGAALGGSQSARFMLYVWKDVYIVVLLEALWSFANLVFTASTARWAYGVFCAFGSLGGISGNLAVGVLADRLGTAPVLWLALPLFALQALLVWFLGRAAGRPGPRDGEGKSLRGGLQVLRSSAYLGWMLALVGVVQIVITLIDYQYNVAIEQAFADTDARTRVIGQVYAAIDGASLVLQLGTGAVLRFVGLRATLLGIPLIVGASLIAFVALPRFALMALTKVASKAFDYSLFRAAKEMLYIPLSYDEKTRGKALVDMLTYRVAKGGASALVAGFASLGAYAAVLYVTVGLVGAWLGLTRGVVRRHGAVSAEATTPGDRDSATGQGGGGGGDNAA